MKLLEHFSRSDVDEEYSQAIARVVITAIATVIVFVHDLVTAHPMVVPIFYFGYSLASIGWAAVIRRRPGHYPGRRIASIVGDFVATSVGLYFLDSFGAALYPLYLWIVVGNGMRFGQRYLLIAMVASVASFSLVLLLSDYWRANVATGIGLLGGMVILPLFYLVLIRRLHRLNERLELELEKTQHAATHDYLTGLSNRAYFMRRLDEEASLALRHQRSFTVMYIDLDKFKEINDRYGHQYGDDILIITANRLRNMLRSSDVVARLGGDEFALLLPMTGDAAAVESLSRRIVEALCQPAEVRDVLLEVGVSLGIGIFPQHGATVTELIRYADAAMYSTKRSRTKGRRSEDQ